MKLTKYHMEIYDEEWIEKRKEEIVKSIDEDGFFENDKFSLFDTIEMMFVYPTPTTVGEYYIARFGCDYVVGSVDPEVTLHEFRNNLLKRRKKSCVPWWFIDEIAQGWAEQEADKNIEEQKEEALKEKAWWG